MSEITDEFLPLELKNIFESVEYEDFGKLLIDSIEINNQDNIHFNFTVNIEGDYSEIGFNENHSWNLLINNCREYRIEDSRDFESFIYVYSEHILLSNFKEKWKELYFNGENKNVNQLFVEFYNLHKYTFDDFIAMDKFICNRNLTKLLNSNNALFARGPISILEEYFQLLKNGNKNPYYLETANNYKNSEINKNLKIIFIGNNYFISENFEFQKR
ncbi:hypothetical protein SAMN05421847_0243 [Halpernia humi]|uniref:Uncharacterized protein n=1 Tax=Halpernia humi TaxID=493375 RepID=A0A1H5STJ5_9FLAO|nr:hypothetical protein [Halpernia humi]SEF53161.1 hypothetical protein SAMN05421847_0243 [Halpernia humi]